MGAFARGDGFYRGKVYVGVKNVNGSWESFIVISKSISSSINNA
jgi:hypothetical protein